MRCTGMLSLVRLVVVELWPFAVAMLALAWAILGFVSQ